MTSVNNELSGKRLELLMEVIPKLSRVALLWNPANPNTVRVVQETETMARSLGWRFKLLRLKQLTTSMAHFEWRSKSVLRRSCWEVVAFSALTKHAHHRIGGEEPSSGNVSQHSIC